MAASILTMLKAVPWSEVLSAAPSVVGGARKLWDSVGSKPAAEASAPASEEAVAGDRLAALSARLDRSEQDVAALKAQMREASALIASLAEQNSQLIATMERTRRRGLQLAAAVAVLAAACVVLAVSIVRLA